MENLSVEIDGYLANMSPVEIWWAEYVGKGRFGDAIPVIPGMRRYYDPLQAREWRREIPNYKPHWWEWTNADL